MIKRAGFYLLKGAIAAAAAFAGLVVGGIITVFLGLPATGLPPQVVMKILLAWLFLTQIMIAILLRECSSRLGIWLGTSFLEKGGKDFFNTFVLSSPEGAVAGQVRKQFPSMGEAFFFKGEPGSHVIETALGKIGVGICFDAHAIQIARLTSAQSIDLMLMPHSYSVPAAPTKNVSEADIARMKNNLRDMAHYYARLLGVPAVSVNKCGPALAPKPEGYVFPGLTTIVDSDGKVQARLKDEEGFVAAQVTLDPSRKIQTSPHAYGRYIYPGPAGRVLFGLVEGAGRLWYSLSSNRRSSARAALLSPNQAFTAIFCMSCSNTVHSEKG